MTVNILQLALMEDLLIFLMLDMEERHLLFTHKGKDSLCNGIRKGQFSAILIKEEEIAYPMKSTKTLI